MKFTSAVAATALAGVSVARTVPLQDAKAAALARAIANSPSGDYAPEAVTCPSTRPTIREASSLSSEETAWLELRRSQTVAPMTTLLERGTFASFNPTTYIESISSDYSKLPNIGIAVSGGGYRSLLCGAGFLAAADSRTGDAAGSLGGLLQSTTYLAGLSGGSWLVGSVYLNNFSTIVDLRDGSVGSDVWKFEQSILEGPKVSGISILDVADYYINLVDQVKEKSDAGFDTSITDYWGRALSYQLVNATDGGLAYTFSSIALASNFAAGEIPLPIIVANEREPGTDIISLNSTVYEINPFEIGSWDPSLYGFAPLEYVGSDFDAGVVPTSGQCVRGLDQAGFILGTSSSLFNEILTELGDYDIPSYLVDAIDDVLDLIGFDDYDISKWSPNPFYGFNSNINPNAASTSLSLVDGGEDDQNIPLDPLIQPGREVDVIFAVDNSADTTYNWPEGISLVKTYERSLSAAGNGTAFPAIPDVNTIINLGLNKRPTFFGCDAANTTSYTPLIVYVPNSPYSAFSNVSTFDLDYAETQRNAIIQNGFNVATRGNNTLDAEWPTCVSCAILSRSFYKTGTTVPAECTACFDTYCWDGTLDTSTPATYEPSLAL